MSFLHPSFNKSDESLSSESPQSSPNTSENVPSPDITRTDNTEEYGTILYFSRAFWNLPADDSTEAGTEQDASIIDDEAIISTSDIDEMPESDRVLSLFRRNSVQRKLENCPSSDRKTEPVILKQLKIINLFDHLFLILVTLVPASAMAVGSQYIGHCPANWFVPHLVLSIGVLSTIFIVFLIVNLCREHFATSGGKDLNGVGKIFGWLLGSLMLIGRY
ncbi:hypothetical protein AVEN_148235-1 [Araneus ventricosus]|uniref:Uncharacterized protein n=1 Tax=Araneus ventricosus TaxID=182803 RepID=A0A4Y2IGI1_ARAVE|nr:hypothetical protein AVEN_148235-1 [Araneus ventricosus]